MAGDVRVTNFPEPSAKERVAYDLMMFLMRSGVKSPDGDKRKFYLDLYAECIQATSGHRLVS